MFDFYYCGTVPMIPELERIDLISDDDEVCDFKVPTIYYEGLSDTCEEEPVYDWLMDSVMLVKNQYVVKFTESTTNEVLLKDVNGEREWVDGQEARLWAVDIENREDVRVAKEYIVEMYDLEKGEKKRGKVVFDEPSPMDEYELSKIEKFCPAASE